MSRIKLTANLCLDEYIPPGLYERYKDMPNRLIAMLDRRLILADPKLRDRFGPVSINNRMQGGESEWSGIRTPDSPYYGFTSQHS
ncbi:MAG: hypothetical protein JW861_11205 [Bacteroidales bacterium]|nr:hypothetical protein [Bacteroidales bacterium]